jgi:hypothetical protein
VTYADVCAVAHGGGGHAALHTGVHRLSRYSGSIKALSPIQALLRLYPGRILLDTQAFVFVIKAL